MDVLIFADFTRLYSIAGVTVLDVATVASYGFGNVPGGADLLPHGRTLLINDRSTYSATDATDHFSSLDLQRTRCRASPIPPCAAARFGNIAFLSNITV